MIRESIYGMGETSISDLTESEITRWKKIITDRRISKDVGSDTVDLFNGDRFDIEPKYFIAKVYEHGTSFKNYLHSIMSNGDEIVAKSFGIKSSLEMDELQEYKIKSVITINGEEFRTERCHSFEWVCDFYFRWIETRPENFKRFEVTF